ncbi:MAG: tRNA pseudouridine(55) synthase TruB [Ignavibacteriaceae bacterium]|jgi:tRNA pseudouridine55 synthase
MITKATSDFSKFDFQSGEVILIDKPICWSSFKVVYKIRQATGVKKVGHAGTLDPLASGLLIICTGKKTKEITKYQDFEKTYTGTITLGKSSPSMDLETEICATNSTEGIFDKQILDARDSFIGRITQIPPMYSAVKVNGKSLYKIARKGKTIERIPREITIYSFGIKNISVPYIDFEIVCSKGTYIRSIANDFGEKLGCGGLLSSLRRTKIGNYCAEDALDTNEFTKKLKDEIYKFVKI